MIDSKQKLDAFVKYTLTHLEFQIVGVDIESHMPSEKSYEGFVCLLQISLKLKTSKLFSTYLIDSVKIDTDIIRESLGPSIFENEKVIKVMHSSLSNDIGWLQRDFGIQALNVFDIQLEKKGTIDYKSSSIFLNKNESSLSDFFKQ